MSLIKPHITVLAEGLNFPEGPAFDSRGRLWFVELMGGNICRLEGEKVHRVSTQGSPNGLAIDEQDRVWFCDASQNAIRIFDLRTGDFSTVCDHVDGQPLNKPNDLAFDIRGNLVFTCPGESRWEPTGYVCCMMPDGVVAKIAENLYFPNGLVFTGDGSELIVAETRRQRLWKGAWNASSRTWVPKPWASVGGNVGPDGMALDAHGVLYVAVYSSGNIKSVLPNGEVKNLYELPGANPTNCAFDPTGKLALVVTEAEKGQLLSLAQVSDGIFPYKGLKI